MRGRAIKPNHGTEIPTQFVVFDCETSESQTVVDGEYALSFRLACATAWREERGAMTRVHTCAYNTPRALWNWISERTHKEKSTWIWCHNLGFDLTVSRFWTLWEVGRFEKSFCCIEDPPTILAGRLDGHKVVLCDTVNWFRSKLADLGKWCGLDKLPMPASDARLRDWIEYCERDVEITVAVVRQIVKLVKSNDLGCLRYTAASQAMQGFRHKMESAKIIIPDSSYEDKLARDGYYGGRVELFFRGRVTTPERLFTGDDARNPAERVPIVAGPVYALDVSAMYCSVLASEKLPWRHRCFTHNGTVDCLREQAKHHGAIAEVLIETNEPLFPNRHEGMVVYPVGKFWTVLSGVELDQALFLDCVRECGRVSTYDCAASFSNYAHWLWQQRQKAKIDGDLILERFWKDAPCHLYGKFAQQSYAWEDAPDLPCPYPWGTFYYHKEPDHSSIVCRALNGKAEIRKPPMPGPHSFPAISAFVTAAARQRMNELRDIAGAGNVYYQCVDSLHVNSSGLERLDQAGKIGDCELGKLRLTETYQDIVYYGLNLLRIDGKWKAAGLPGLSEVLSDGSLSVTTFERLDSILSRAPDGFLRVRKGTWQPDFTYRHSVVNADGWCEPLVIGGRS